MQPILRTSGHGSSLIQVIGSVLIVKLDRYEGDQSHVTHYVTGSSSCEF